MEEIKEEKKEKKKEKKSSSLATFFVTNKSIIYEFPHIHTFVVVLLILVIHDF